MPNRGNRTARPRPRLFDFGHHKHTLLSREAICFCPARDLGVLRPVFQYLFPVLAADAISGERLISQRHLHCNSNHIAHVARLQQDPSLLHVCGAESVVDFGCFVFAQYEERCCCACQVHLREMQGQLLENEADRGEPVWVELEDWEGVAIVLGQGDSHVKCRRESRYQDVVVFQRKWLLDTEFLEESFAPRLERTEGLFILVREGFWYQASFCPTPVHRRHFLESIAEQRPKERVPDPFHVEELRLPGCRDQT